MDDKKNVNPSEYGYAGDENIIISARDFQEIFMLVEKLLELETKLMFPEKYMYVDKETSKKVKATKTNKDKIAKVVDPKGTLAAQPTVYRTENGMSLLALKNFLAEKHFKNVEDGVAKHRDELFKNKEENELSVAE